MANIGYIQVVRHCNHFCGFCSNPTTPYEHTLETMKVLVDDLVDRGYFGVILTGGEPTLHAELPRITEYASSRGLHVRMITNGWRLADGKFAQDMANAGLKLVHVSVYSVRPEVEFRLRGIQGTLDRAFAAIENAHQLGVEVNINSVINKLNADHLDENISHFIKNHSHIRHFVWNNLDPSMGRAEVNQDQYTPRLADFEKSLHKALTLLHRSGRTFRVERVPLCYMTDFAWASTETRKIVKGEERVVHFLDEKQTVRQTDWEHIYSPSCNVCTLRPICGGLFDRGNAYDPNELSPVFVSLDSIAEKIITDPADPSYPLRALHDWKVDFARRVEEAKNEPPRENKEPPRDPNAPAVGLVSEESVKRYQAKRKAEAALANKVGYQQEKLQGYAPTRDRCW